MRNRVEVLHGVNLDMLGRRDPEHYGVAVAHRARGAACSASPRELGLEPTFSQTNHEGEFCELLHRARETADGLVLNPGAWTHYSYAIRDALEVAGAAGGRGAHLGGRRARGLAPRVGDPRPLRRARAGQGRGRLPRGARAAAGELLSVSA